MISQNHKNGLRNPWLLGMLGAIIVVLSINSIFVWLAMHNRSSLVDREYSTRDRKSDAAVLGDLQSHKALAWKTTIKQPKAITMDSPVAYEISVADRENVPVSGAMEVEAYRAADASKDFLTTFREVSPGNYQGFISFPLKGYWELRIRIKRGGDVFEVNTDRFSVAMPR
ncbi:MAG TPA: FixH family protein [Gallionella sp.]|nr:FixH family protein [Gallionella sp.]